MRGESWSLRQYLIAYNIIVVVMVIGFLTGLSYLQAIDQLAEQDRALRSGTATHVVESVLLVDQGQRVVDASLNRDLQRAFEPFLAAYDHTGGDPSRLDLDAVRAASGDRVDGRLDLYVIDPRGVVVASTVRDELGLDFSNWSPAYYAGLVAILENGVYSADRATRSAANGSAGELRKYAFMPTGDRRYLLELGLTTPFAADERISQSPEEAAAEATLINPDVVGVRVFDAWKNLLDGNGTAVNATLDPVLAARLDRCLKDEAQFEVREPDGRITQYLRIDLAGNSTASAQTLVVELVYSHQLAARQAAELLLFHLLIGSAACVLGVVFAFGASRYVTRPVRAIVEDVEAIAHGDLDRRIRPIPSREFEALVAAINRMVGTIRRYGNEIALRRAELAIASEIQAAFLPRTLPAIPGFECAAVNRPAREVGGDLHDLIPLSAGRIAIVCADVSGKGMPAALFMGLIRTVLRSAAPRFAAPAKVMRTANEACCEDAGERGTFVTTFYGVLRPERRTFRYVNAGHNPPLLFRAATGVFETLEPTGPALGLVCGIEFGEAEVALEPGDALVLFTDGVVEAIDEHEKEFGEERLRETIRAHASASAETILQEILAAVGAHCGGTAQFDDITLVVIRARTNGA
jgi:serine phosphatase RsbU (regulator of sigma subunit)